MRKLTVLRRKSFVASLMKVKLYISDEASNELTINGVKCRKLGEVANGKEVEFNIGNHGATLFAIIDTLSKDFCNNHVKIESGESDISVSGKNKFSPLKGNPFIFDK